MENNIKDETSFDNFLTLDIRTGTIIEAEYFPKAKRPAYKLKIDFGHHKFQVAGWLDC